MRPSSSHLVRVRVRVRVRVGVRVRVRASLPGDQRREGAKPSVDQMRPLPPLFCLDGTCILVWLCAVPRWVEVVVSHVETLTARAEPLHPFSGDSRAPQVNGFQMRQGPKGLKPGIGNAATIPETEAFQGEV